MQTVLFLDFNMQKHIDFLLKIKHFRKYNGMYVTDDKFESIAAFIGGMDFFQHDNLLNEFRIWLLEKYQIESAFGWSSLIRMLHVKSCLSQTHSDKMLNDFLFDNLESFLNSKSK